MATPQTMTKEVAESAAHAARDAFYVMVGLGVLGIQRAQVQRVELQRKLAGDPRFGAGLAGAQQFVSESRQRLESFLDEATTAAETTLGPLEEQLPKAARELSQRAQEGARQLGGQLRQLVGAVRP